MAKTGSVKGVSLFRGWWIMMESLACFAKCSWIILLLRAEVEESSAYSNVKKISRIQCSFQIEVVDIQWLNVLLFGFVSRQG
jgi:hypothetical protein